MPDTLVRSNLYIEGLEIWVLNLFLYVRLQNAVWYEWADSPKDWRIAESDKQNQQNT